MSYSKQNFRSGDTLYASQLNAMDDEIAVLEAEVESTKNMVGSPLTASTAAGMTDQAKIYVYTGSETGYTAGHWYYHNGTAWTDGGVYNSVAVNTDTSLTVPGQAADSKAVGDALDDIDTEMSDVKETLSKSAPVKDSTETNVDLDISDQQGNVILRLKDGHIYTKNFDSSETLPIDGTLTQAGEAADAKAVGDRIIKATEAKGTTATGIDLDITDGVGNVIVRFANGGIQTKNFDSASPANGSPLRGKVIVNFGDSIFGNRRPPNDISTAIANATGATVYNCGFGGCRMAKHDYSYLSTWGKFSMWELADAIVTGDFSGQDAAVLDTSWGMPSYFPETLATLKSIDFDNVDIITIAYGANDFNGAVVVEDQNSPLSPATFSGALRYSIEKFLTAYPHIRIFCLGQIYGYYVSGGEFVDDTNTHELNGQTLGDFIQATENVAKEYNLPFINNYNVGIGKLTRLQYLVDTSHPNADGTALLAEHIVHELF